MVLSFVGVGAKVAAAGINSIISLVNAQFSTAIVPATVAGSGVALGTAGRVTFTAATTISVNSCFSATYDNYLIFLDVSASSATADIGFRFRSGGTDDSSTSWQRAFQDIASGTPTTTFATAQTSGIVAAVSAASCASRLEVHGAALAQRKYVLFQGGSSTLSRQGYATTSAATAFDGFTILPASGTLTGTLRMYGLNNN